MQGHAAAMFPCEFAVLFVLHWPEACLCTCLDLSGLCFQCTYEGTLAGLANLLA